VQPIQGGMTYRVSQQLADLFKGNEGNTLGAEIACRAALPPPKSERSRRPWGVFPIRLVAHSRSIPA
jgi:hypothetical protein